MCRLFGLSAGRQRVTATFWLLDAPDNLRGQSVGNPDGTGLGTYDASGRPIVEKQPLPAYADPAFAAEAREREAEAESKATQLVSAAIAAGDIQSVQYFLGLKYVEALKDIGTAPNAKLVLLPLEASGVAGAVTGVAELLRASGPVVKGAE